MGTVHHLTGPDHRRAAGDRADDASGDLELPGWEDFSAARERFFAGLRSASRLYRDGEARADDRDAGASPENLG